MWRERGQQAVFVDKGVYIWQNEWDEKNQTILQVLLNGVWQRKANL